MNNSLEELLLFLEPRIIDIHDNRYEIKALKEVDKTFEELIKLAKVSIMNIIDYYDQEFIIKAIKISNRNVLERLREYEVCCYLLKNSSDTVKELPQYKKSIDYMHSLYEYLLQLYEKTNIEYQEKEEKLERQELFNKYYMILKKDKIFIEEVSDFLAFLELCDLDPEQKLDIVMFINDCNNKRYIFENKISFNDNLNIKEITKVIEENKELLTNSNLDSIKDKKLTLPLNKLLNTSEEDYFELLELKEIYLINEINNLYNDYQYGDIHPLLNELSKIKDYKEEFEKQKRVFNYHISNKLLFVLDNDKSLVREYLDTTDLKYQPCIYKNLLDIESNKELDIPTIKYKDIYLYLKDDFIIKTIYTYLEDAILIIGVLEEKQTLDDFIDKYKMNISKTFNELEILKNNNIERDIILKDVKLEDLILLVDLNTLDIKKEDISEG